MNKTWGGFFGYLGKSSSNSQVFIILMIDRLPASPATSLFSNLLPSVFRYAATTANEL